ncbi:MAG: glycine cleavage system protein T [Verrucomicrobia bacterium]|nr:glycine cleavage system protein T [Verrucomicrobiota bacterium]
MKKTIFHDLHVELGARMAEFGGFMMPIQYQGIIAEHMACRNGATLFDTCHMGEFKLAGDGVVADLERLVSCDVASMKYGQCRYGLLCNEKGGVIDDLLVYRFADKDFMLVVNAGTQDNDFAWVEAHLSAGTRAENVSDQTAKIDLQGPATPKIMQKLMAETVADLKFYHFMKNKYRGAEVIVSRTGYTGEMGFEIYGDAATATAFWKECMELGAVPAGLGARDTLRLEVGMPLYGHELSEERNAAESGFSRSISDSKTFIGCESLRNAANVKSALVGIELEGRRAARNGDGLADAGGRPVGIVTSGSFAPSLEKAIALGYVEKKSAAPGTVIAVKTARSDIPGRVVELPFYKGGSARRPVAEFLGTV